ncbi:zinc-dependent alcohol dehydrogenase [Nocardia australiensis]|uniref:zinc-dependent alcohol dehydrogenase n=1 Tax=Nocardia australiensis TaxID=2887191 RepID=UPI001D142D02|nr:alcohol dehydrogenase catalytic domain-containing protein [Nocardia australiensis]
MKALVLEEFGRLVIEDRPTPTVGPDEVLLKLTATGICGSDLHGYTGENGRRVPGQVMGHESVGYVARCGADVDDVPVGSLATFNPVLSCGSCSGCDSGNDHHCGDRRVIGVDPQISAGFAEYVAVPARNITLLPAEFPAEYGALIEPLAVGFHAVARGAVQPDQCVLIIGGGPIGQAAAIAAKHAGALVTVSEPNAARRALCRRLGAHAIDPVSSTLDEEMRRHTGRLADVTIDAVGLSATIGAALSTTRVGGNVVLVGMASPSIELAAFTVSTAERALIGSFSYSPNEFRAAAQWATEHPDTLSILVERRVSLPEAPAAFAQLASGDLTAGKVLVLLQPTVENKS